MRQLVVAFSILFCLLGCEQTSIVDSAVVDAERAAAVVIASNDDITPEAPDDDEVKVPRKDCKVCKGTGRIKHGDGHFTDCTNCEPSNDIGAKSEDIIEELPGAMPPEETPAYCKNCFAAEILTGKKCECGIDCKCEGGECVLVKSKPPIDAFVSKKCCEDCICKDRCGCSYAGECLVNLNGGKPVTICKGNRCTIYSNPNAIPMPEPEIDDGIDISYKLELAEKLLKQAAIEYKEKKFSESAAHIRHVMHLLKKSKHQSVSGGLSTKINAAIKNLEAQGENFDSVYIIPKQEYDKFVSDYWKYIENVELMKARLQALEAAPKTSAPPMGYYESSSGDCESGSCGISSMPMGRFGGRMSSSCGPGGCR